MNAYKKYYNYSYIENKLNENNIAKQIILNMQQPERNLYDDLNDKKIIL